jgi:hypothetical protein
MGATCAHAIFSFNVGYPVPRHSDHRASYSMYNGGAITDDYRILHIHISLVSVM